MYTLPQTPTHSIFYFISLSASLSDVGQANILLDFQKLDIIATMSGTHNTTHIFGSASRLHTFCTCYKNLVRVWISHSLEHFCKLCMYVYACVCVCIRKPQNLFQTLFFYFLFLVHIMMQKKTILWTFV